MSRRHKLEHFVTASQHVLRQSAQAMCYVAAIVATKATRQADRARPIVAEKLRATYLAIRRQSAAAKPVVRSLVIGGVAAIASASHRWLAANQAAAFHRLSRAFPAWRRPWADRFGASGTICLIALAAAALGATLLRVHTRSVVGANQATNAGSASAGRQPEIEFPLAANPSQPLVTDHSVGGEFQPLSGFRTSEQAAESARKRQRAELELQQAAAEYDSAVQLWNAEVAACQSGPAPGYTPNQMGRLAAMGYRPQPQPQRQPNQALYEAALRAEQRYLRAQEACRQLSQAQ